jgi:HEAT repeat protein
LARPELEFFILSIVREHHHHLCIFDSPNLGEFVGRLVPPFTRDEVIDSLYDMFCCGDLAARRVTKRRRVRPFVPTREEIDAALCGALDIEYGLTAQGGERWELMSQFDWRYHLAGFSATGVESTSAEMIDVYLAWAGSSVPGSEKQTAVRPWQATYWKSLPEGIRVRYLEKTGDKPAWEPLHDLFRDLWLDEFHRCRDGELRSYVPMKSVRTKPVLDAAWRRRFQSMGSRRTSVLLRLLNDTDTGVQYAAALKLAQAPDPAVFSRLVGWFQERRSRFALRVVSKLDHPQVLDSLIRVFSNERWGERPGGTAFRRDLQLAIAAFGAAAVPKMVPFLLSDTFEMQIGALRTLAKTRSSDAGKAILDWMGTLKPDRSNEHYWRVKESLLALASLADLRVLPTLVVLLGERPELALKPLVLFNLPETRKILEEFIHSSARIRDRRMAAAALTEIDPGFQREHERLRLEAEKEQWARESNWLIGGDGNEPISDPSPALTAILSDKDSDRRAAAIILLCRRDDDFPSESIATLLSDPAARVRANAAYALGLRGTRDDASRILPLMHDNSGIVRYSAQQALRHLDAPTPQ